MWPQGPGMVGALPWPAWGAVVSMLSSLPERHLDKAWRTTVLELRRTCKALAELVGAICVGGAGRLLVDTADAAAQLEAAATAGLGRSLVVKVRLPFDAPELEEQEALAEALALGVERDHMIWFMAAPCKYSPTANRMIEAALIVASREDLLLGTYFQAGESLGWSVDAMSQLSIVGLSSPERETIAMLVGAGALQRIDLWGVEWADVSILSSLREVSLHYPEVEDFSSLADVPLLTVDDAEDLTALPAMRNDVLEVVSCYWLTDVSGLAGGHVGRLELRHLDSVKDVSAIGAMRPPPRTVILEDMPEVQDVSMLAGVHRLEVIKCPKLDKAATLAALEGKVGTVLWREE